jgi:GNAT superfamily N-acetyltransferase
MQFELSRALTENILFHMENQVGEFLLDTGSADIIDARMAGQDGNGRYVPLPRWRPADGFRLMERFVAGLRSTKVKDELSAVLDSGKGVFRSFKDTLCRYPETEKLWFAYKAGAMKHEVVSWYNAMRESWGLELIGEEPEDIAALVLEDFRFREAAKEDMAPAEKLHGECGGGFPGMGEWFFPGDISFVAETYAGDFAGYACAVVSGGCLQICAVEVAGEYRGLGLGKSLVAKLLERADSQKITRAVIDLPAGQEYFSRVLLREFFKPAVQRYVREMQGVSTEDTQAI